MRTHRLTIRVLAPLLMVLLSASAASAMLDYAWVEVPISPAALTADPALADCRTLDLVVTTDNIWTTAELIVELTEGSFYNDGTFNQNYPQPSFFGLAPQLEFDTFAAGYNPAAAYPNSLEGPNLLGKHPIEGVGAPIFSDTKISVAWGDSLPADAGPGTFTILRMTFTDDAEGWVTNGHLWEIDNPSVAIPIADYYVPEPATFGLLLVGALGVRRRH